VDFRGREEKFREADRRYVELKRQLDAGSISTEEFEAERQRLMVLEEGRWWNKFGESGEWHYHDGNTWVRDTPPGYQEEVNTEPTSPPAQTPPPPPPKGAENGGNGRQKMPLWIPVAGLGGIALVGIVLIFWVLVPYLQGGTAPGGAGFDAAFVHRATPENISANSTYLDDPLTNDNPDAILYVTQNWNPGGNGDTYNEHPIGVWYDSSRQRWAIFNQDREAMPDGAAFNVAVLEEPTETR
jgi:hypothetical protein